MFSGEPMSQEAVESLLDAMDYIVKQTKVINKNTCLRNIVIQTITDASLGGNTLKFVIRDLVQQLSTKYNTTNPYELADYLKIHVLTWDLHEQINGFYKYEKRNRFIVINTNLSPSMQRTVCAHELGHAVLHTHANTPFLRKNTFFSVDKLEIEANTFAALLLIDKRTIQPGDTKACIAYKNNIPVELLEFYKPC